MSVRSHISNNLTTCPNVTKHFVHLAVNTWLSHVFTAKCTKSFVNGGLFVPLRQCNTMCSTSGFVDDVIFSHNEANGAGSKTTLCLTEFAGAAAPGRILLS